MAGAIAPSSMPVPPSLRLASLRPTAAPIILPIMFYSLKGFGGRARERGTCSPAKAGVQRLGLRSGPRPSPGNNGGPAHPSLQEQLGGRFDDRVLVEPVFAVEIG